MWAVILPQAFSMWYIVIMRTNFSMLPESLFESAYIDGANDWFVYRRIVMPLSTAIIATIAIWAAVGHWNNFFGPLLYLQSPEKQTLPILLRRILISREAFVGAEEAVSSADEGGGIAAQGIYESLRMAVIFITIGPILIVYPFAQKYFTKGILAGSLKG
ncbi:MAG: carbohydrate ABC transporter permease, partial [Spirochaetales bacterium]|nr:carbohydrate ABC transporter permease [Spirochaetales bacterium]